MRGTVGKKKRRQEQDRGLAHTHTHTHTYLTELVKVNLNVIFACIQRLGDVSVERVDFDGCEWRGQGCVAANSRHLLLILYTLEATSSKRQRDAVDLAVFVVLVPTGAQLVEARLARRHSLWVGERRGGGEGRGW